LSDAQMASIASSRNAQTAAPDAAANEADDDDAPALRQRRSPLLRPTNQHQLRR